MKEEDYVHRIGRTGRAGRAGLAVTLAERRDFGMVQRIQRFTTQRIPSATIEGLEPKRAEPAPARRAALRPSPARRAGASAQAVQAGRQDLLEGRPARRALSRARRLEGAAPGPLRARPRVRPPDSDAEQLDLEHQRRVRRDHAAGAARAVAELGRDRQHARAADLHALHAFVPAADHLAGAEVEARTGRRGPCSNRTCLPRWLAAVRVVQPAGVVHAHVAGRPALRRRCRRWCLRTAGRRRWSSSCVLLAAKPAMMPAQRRQRAAWPATRRRPSAASIAGRPEHARRPRCSAATGSRRSSARRAVLLGQLLAVGAEHQRRVQVARRRQAERALQQDLARGVVGQVLAAHDVA